MLIALVVVGIGTAVHRLNKLEAEHAISPSQFDAVQLGTSQQAVETQLGKAPETTSDFISKGALHSTQVQRSCIYYNQTGQTFGDVYSFCFTNGSLTSKSSF